MYQLDGTGHQKTAIVKDLDTLTPQELQENRTEVKKGTYTEIFVFASWGALPDGSHARLET